MWFAVFCAILAFASGAQVTVAVIRGRITVPVMWTFRRDTISELREPRRFWSEVANFGVYCGAMCFMTVWAVFH